MKKIVLSMLSLALLSSVAVAASANEASTNSVIKPQAIFYDREPNDKRADANFFSIGDGNQISGTLPIGDAADWYTFTPSTTGKYRFYFSHSSLQFYSMVVKGDGVGTVGKIEYNDPIKYFDATVEAGKTYYIEVSGGKDDTADFGYDIYTYKIN
ncbi:MULTISPECIES: hypothetical protein [Brevibacillus]|jgi:lipoprotein-anchoring transpeptidase ErfK/SrfK|uniref:hypothetical protein n=1 Tax=Brevibacillus TaxID=55080 RepID=UPI00046A2E58|nr:hypothetical protein [Brevibacillus borstelensis]KKX55355.1 hypothetical protein X546_06590 [Brevibacillus borstelensis cifa_chp40]MCC0567031.1 hypothetical protein [Brevibacillus borstelensis]MCM3469334.1 hypothetical protein [Brevibacillus borstelensis]MCM3558718.1 hypothetical protein [Brevibacillus borstelensis]MCM3593815.1 hypothetical protein [Brevibacillus borstelensis]